VRISLRFLLPLIAALFAVAYVITPVVDGLLLRWHVRDLDIRASLIAASLQEPAYDATSAAGYGTRTAALLTRFSQDERVFGLALCDQAGNRAIASHGFPARVVCPRATDPASSDVIHIESGPLHISRRPLLHEEARFATLLVVHDMSFVQRRSEDTRKYLFYLLAGIAAIVSLITVVIAELSWRGWIKGMRAMLANPWGASGNGRLGEPPELKPLAKDLRELMRDIESERSGLRDEAQVTWSPEALRRILHEDLKGEEIIILSNREPYIHEHKDGVIVMKRPASGLVTALEPVMRACSGTWIAHGSGSADREVVDRRDHLAVPPDKPEYELRRLWLLPEEERGYYYGFANMGLWPLCHIAHVRPTFRSEDFDYYRRVNLKFAEAVVQEAKTKDPIVLVQDYHFALLPRMIRDRLPDATIIAFWHIPWPNPEAFGICPWREELLEGMLGSSILGFHTQFHCNNFLDTVDRYLEARVDRESFTVTLRGEQTAVHRYPISIDWPLRAKAMDKSIADCRAGVRAANALAPDSLLGVGVDRLDYTKGIVERFLAIERLMEFKPEWIGRFAFVQIGAPSRSAIDEYRKFAEEVKAHAERINARFGREGWRPIVLRAYHHEPEEIYEYFRGSELAFVSSLHDGMNLVAKEFIAARDDEQGTLVLSQFTGASRELPEALIVNPYDIDQCAAALHVALTMPAEEQRARMRSMRSLVREFNVYRWAGRMLLDAAKMRMRRRVLKRSGTGTSGF
jgi:trehalose-6-phosphate synthase